MRRALAPAKAKAKANAKETTMEKFLCPDRSEIQYETYGEGLAVFFIHGWSVERHLWQNRIESIPGEWKSRYKRVYFDLPGMGASLGAKSIRRSDDMLADIEAFIAFINGDSDYILAGESYGGYLARGLLSRQKSKIKGLFLLCPLVYPGWRQGKVAPKVVLEKDEAFLATLSAEERVGFDFLSIVETKPMWEMYKADIRLGIMKGNEGFLDKQLDGAFSPAVDVAVVEYDKPTLVLLGRQDTEVGFEDQYELYKAWKRATIQILDKAGHNLQIERNGLFSASFLDLLERIETDRA